MEEKARGSERLLEAYKAGGFKLDESLVNDFADRLREIDIHDILIKGQPVPDFMRATFKVNDPKHGGMVIGELLDVIGGRDGLPATIRVFPRGIPWPGEFNVDLSVNQQF